MGPDNGDNLFSNVMMGFQDTVNYVFYKNPLVSGVVEYAKVAISSSLPVAKKSAEIIPVQTAQPIMTLWQIGCGRNFVRIAGLFGATAVALGAYGAHVIYPKEGGDADELKRIYETANRYHFLHSLALLGVPLCRFPRLSGTFMVLGMVLFCGTCYYRAITGGKDLQRFTPIGGSCLIIGWLVMIL